MIATLVVVAALGRTVELASPPSRIDFIDSTIECFCGPGPIERLRRDLARPLPTFESLVKVRSDFTPELRGELSTSEEPGTAGRPLVPGMLSRAVLGRIRTELDRADQPSTFSPRLNPAHPNTRHCLENPVGRRLNFAQEMWKTVDVL